MNWLTASIFRIYFSRCLITKGALRKVAMGNTDVFVCVIMLCSSVSVWSNFLSTVLGVGYVCSSGRGAASVAKLSSHLYSFLLQIQQLISSKCSHIREMFCGVFQETLQILQNREGGRKRVGGWREGTMVSLVKTENWSDLFDFNNFYQNESPLRRPRHKFGVSVVT